nr:hypothetical protein [Gammaproteobacteria bacterium]
TELRRLQRTCQSPVDLVGLQTQLARQRTEYIERRGMLDFLSNQFESIVAQMLQMSEMSTLQQSPIAYIHEWLIRTAAPDALASLMQLHQLDPTCARQSLVHMKDMVARADQARCVYDVNLCKVIAYILSLFDQRLASMSTNLE